MFAHSSEAEQKRGNIQAHGPPICLRSAGQGSGWWRDWLLIGSGSPTLNLIGFGLQRGRGSRGGGCMIWNLEETRDCWISVSKGRDRRLVTMTFLQNNPTGRLYLAVLFVYVWCSHFSSLHCTLSTHLASEQVFPCAFVYLCNQCEKKPDPPTQIA